MKNIYTIVAVCPVWEDMSPLVFQIECDDKDQVMREAKKQIAFSMFNHGASRTEEVMKACFEAFKKEDEDKTDILIFKGKPFARHYSSNEDM